MLPLRLLALGMLMVVVDINLTFDVLVDPIGWMLIVYGLTSVLHVHPSFRPAQGAAIASLVASLGLVVNLGSLVTVVANVVSILATAAFVWFTCDGLIHTLGESEAPSTVANLVRWGVLATSALTLVGLMIGFNQAAFLPIAIIGGLALILILAGTCWMVARRPQFTPRTEQP